MDVALVTFLSWSYKQEKMPRNAEPILHEHKATDLPESAKNTGVNIVYVVLGLDRLERRGLLVDLRGNGHRKRPCGIPASIIGLMMIALGKSLPELFATVIATIRRHGDETVGNILGTLGSTSAIELLVISTPYRSGVL